MVQLGKTRRYALAFIFVNVLIISYLIKINAGVQVAFIFFLHELQSEYT